MWALLVSGVSVGGAGGGERNGRTGSSGAIECQRPHVGGEGREEMSAGASVGDMPCQCCRVGEVLQARARYKTCAGEPLPGGVVGEELCARDCFDVGVGVWRAPFCAEDASHTPPNRGLGTFENVGPLDVAHRLIDSRQHLMCQFQDASK